MTHNPILKTKLKKQNILNIFLAYSIRNSSYIIRHIRCNLFCFILFFIPVILYAQQRVDTLPPQFDMQSSIMTSYVRWIYNTEYGKWMNDDDRAHLITSNYKYTLNLAGVIKEYKPVDIVRQLKKDVEVVIPSSDDLFLKEGRRFINRSAFNKYYIELEAQVEALNVINGSYTFHNHRRNSMFYNGYQPPEIFFGGRGVNGVQFKSIVIENVRYCVLIIDTYEIDYEENSRGWFDVKRYYRKNCFIFSVSDYNKLKKLIDDHSIYRNSNLNDEIIQTIELKTKYAFFIKQDSKIFNERLIISNIITQVKSPTRSDAIEYPFFIQSVILNREKFIRFLLPSIFTPPKPVVAQTIPKSEPAKITDLNRRYNEATLTEFRKLLMK